METVRSSLSDLLRKNVPGPVRRKGEDYYRFGSVRHLNGDACFVHADVQGAQLYDVTIRYFPEDFEMHASCTCPYFLREGLCKHIWAVLLAADKRGLLSRAAEEGCEFLFEVEKPECGRVADAQDDFKDDEGAYRRDRGSLLASKRGALQHLPVSQKPSRPSWKSQLDEFAFRYSRHAEPVRAAWPATRRILYIIDATGSRMREALTVEAAVQDRKKNGEWGAPRSPSISRSTIDTLPDHEDRVILARLAGGADARYHWGFYYDETSEQALTTSFVLSRQLSLELVPAMCATGRFGIRATRGSISKFFFLKWDDGPPWEFGIDVALDEERGNYALLGVLRRGEEKMAVSEPLLLSRLGLLFTEETAARVEFHDAFVWIRHLQEHGPIHVPRGDGEALLERMFSLPVQAPLRLPPEILVEEVRPTPKPLLKLHEPRQKGSQPILAAHWEFSYDGAMVHASDPRGRIYQPESRRILVRDLKAEQDTAARLLDLGFREPPVYQRSDKNLLEISSKRLASAVAELLSEEWRVEAEGKLYRNPGHMSIEVNSGIDWFELHGNVNFDDQSVELPRLLQALRSGDQMVQLGDGTFGLLPDEWLKKYAPLASLGEAHEDHLRFRPTQVGFLDALLAAMPEARCDEIFRQARDQLRRFDGVKPSDALGEFRGELRPYQRDGLGWLHFLRGFRFGGCLADDMGLGKTIQALAMLEIRRQQKLGDGNGNRDAEPPRPSLVVAPRSLIFNWQEETARFTPCLRVLDYTGAGRHFGRTQNPVEQFADYDLVLTTYGTLRRDAARLKDVAFDYAILDEAQAIKNPSTASAKAVRLLQARHRLVLTGTPVENRLADLWSIFEFLNPGMLGSAAVFNLIGAGAKQAGPETRGLLSRALRPFILRRTKEQVARDLPTKLEQTVYCELKTPQRKLYDELRDHYRRTLLAQVSEEGMNRAKIQVLEALLRLRQAACHPGLIDPARRDDSSAKVDALLYQIEEVMAEGHKALVFSQFTSLLSIVRERLDRQALPYEYLDGQTRDRAACVHRFQYEKGCPLFLISLKAGGLGLNLTAAEYVFLLDPWWNPAVEAQAIDRAHRIGQERQVFAYRLIAKDTVEEKVLELQKAKRDLADAIISEDNSLIRDLSREDLGLLLS